MFSTEALNSDKGQEFIRLWMGGMPAAKALDRAFGEGATEHMAKMVWFQVRADDLLKQVGA